MADAHDDHTRARWYARLLATTRDAVVCIDTEGRVVLFNTAAEQMFGYATTDMLGERVEKLMAEPYAREHHGYIARYEQTGEAHAIGRIRSVAARRSSGEVFPIELSVTEVEIGGPARYGAFIRDISEKVSLQERLLERERMAAIGTTAASFAHELGNPLNNMSMQVRLLERRLSRVEPPVDDKIRQSVDALLSEARRLADLLDQFRALARRQRLEAGATDLAELVTELVRVETPALHSRRLQVSYEVPKPPRTIFFIDREKLRQVLGNLVRNAADAMPGGGQLHVRLLEDESRARIEVHDTGVGVPEGLDVFEPFVSSNPERSGLGLSVALQIIQAHGGTLTHQARPEGGTMFVVELPRQSRRSGRERAGR